MPRRAPAVANRRGRRRTAVTAPAAPIRPSWVTRAPRPGLRSRAAATAQRARRQHTGRRVRATDPPPNAEQAKARIHRALVPKSQAGIVSDGARARRLLPGSAPARAARATAQGRRRRPRTRRRDSDSRVLLSSPVCSPRGPPPPPRILGPPPLAGRSLSPLHPLGPSRAPAAAPRRT